MKHLPLHLGHDLAGVAFVPVPVEVLTLIAPPCPVVDADNVWRSKGWTPASSNDPKQGIIAYGQHKSAGKTRRRASGFVPWRWQPVYTHYSQRQGIIDPTAVPLLSRSWPKWAIDSV
jgi:hypothetical protein